LAPTSPGVLEAVEARRVKYGYGLADYGDRGALRVAVEDCALLGYRGLAVVEGAGLYPVYVVDCQQKQHIPLSELGLVADVNRAELGHKRAILVIREF